MIVNYFIIHIHIKGKRKWKSDDEWRICLISKCFLTEYFLMTQGKRVASWCRCLEDIAFTDDQSKHW